MNPLEMDIIHVFKSLLNKKIKASELILFGSRARGDADSDKSFR